MIWVYDHGASSNNTTNSILRCKGGRGSRRAGVFDTIRLGASFAFPANLEIRMSRGLSLA